MAIGVEARGLALPRVHAARRRALAAFIAVAAGSALGVALDSGAYLLLLTAVLLALGSTLLRGQARARIRSILLLLAVACAAAGWAGVKVRHGPADRLDALVSTPPGREALITVDGVVIDHAAPSPKPDHALAEFTIRRPSTRLSVRVHRLVGDAAAVPASGIVRLRIAGDLDTALLPSPGERVRVTGLFSPVGPPDNWGERDARLWSAQAGVAGVVRLSSPDLIVPDTSSAPLLVRISSRFHKVRGVLTARARGVVERAAGDDPSTRALLLGLVLGIDDDDARALRDVFARQGLAHILSISGFHLTVMSLTALALVRLTGDRGWVEPALVAALVLLYILIVPAQAPILRSAAMVLIILLAEAAGRRYDRLTLLIWIACGLLLWRPLDLYSLGFQLSVGLTALLFWLAGPAREVVFGPLIRGTVQSAYPSLPRRITGHTQTLFATSLMCCTVSTPIVLATVGIVSPLAVIATVLVTPLIVVTLWVGYAALMLGMLIPAAAGLASGVLAVTSGGAVWLVRTIDGLPFSAVDAPPVPTAWVLAATAVGIWWFRPARGPSRRATKALATLGLAAWLGWAWWLAPALPNSVALRVDALAVGDGSCLIIRSGEDAVLWDCGSLSDSGLRPRIVEAARTIGVRRISTAIITHNDIDHFLALPEVLGPLGIECVILSEPMLADAAARPRSAAGALLAILEQRGIEIVPAAAGDSRTIGLARLTFLWPAPGADMTGIKDNDRSLVAAVDVPTTSGVRTLLLTGDIEDRAIAAISAAHPSLHADVVEAPHHGSARPAAIRWVHTLAPAAVLQSTGPSRAQDPRWAAVRERTRWLSTAEHGASAVTIRADGGLHVHAARQQQLNGTPAN